MIVKQWKANQNGVATECTWIFPEEVRLLASLALAIPEGKGALQFSPHWQQFPVPIETDADLSSEESIAKLEAVAVQLVNECFPEGVTYDLRDHHGLEEDFPHGVFEQIDVSDELLIRGLYTLLKGQCVLTCHMYTLMEEAISNVQISREAALELLRERLHAVHGKSVSFKEAHEYLRTSFKAGEFLASYFGHLHEIWIATKHPKCATGPFWTPPLMADDYYETYAALVSVYRHILTGEPGRATADL